MFPPPCCSPFKLLDVLKRLLDFGHMFIVTNDGWLTRGPGVTDCTVGGCKLGVGKRSTDRLPLGDAGGSTRQTAPQMPRQEMSYSQC